MKILVLHLGGTIACTELNGVLTPNADITSYFKDIARKVGGVSFTHKHLTPFLSEHLNGSFINTAIKEVKKAQKASKYNGIIVTHGSDTLAYTASALAYALGNSCTPTVIVCADLPLSDSRSSGHINLHAAVSLIKSGQTNGVFSVYRTSDGNADVFRASRLLRHRAYESELTTVGQPYGKVSFIAPATAIFNKNPFYTECADELAPFDVKFSKRCPVQVIQVYPSMVCPRPHIGCRAVILSTYHSGTLDTNNPSIRKLCVLCRRKGIPVYIDGAGANADYESMNAYGELGISRFPANASPTSMFIKLWAITESEGDIKNLTLSLSGDMLR